MSRVPCIAVVVSLLAGHAGAQIVWSSLNVSSPSASAHAGACMGTAGESRSHSPRVLLFGGLRDNALSNETWTLADGGFWTRQLTPRAPSARMGAGMDAESILFGGFDGQTYLNDTWRYQVPWLGAEDWMPVQPSGPLPPGRAFHAQATWAGTVYVQGGWDGTNVLGDGWMLPWGGSWQPLPPGPSARVGHRMARMPIAPDPDIVLFGGADPSGVALGDTWVLHDGSWQKPTLSMSPPPRFGHVMVTDDLRRRVVLFGGTDQHGTLFRDVWEWDGTSWSPSQVAGAPAARWGHAAVFDRNRGKVVVYGGVSQNDTAEYGTAYLPQVMSFSGCLGNPGTLSIPSTLYPVPDAWVGGVLQLQSKYTNGSAAAVVFAIGTSMTQWAGGSLPLLLSSLGGRGCLAVSPDILIPTPTSFCGSPCLCTCSDLDVPVPDDPSLAGASLYLQAIDTTLWGTNSLHLVLGWK